MRRELRTITSRILAMKFANEFMFIFPLFPIMFGERGDVGAAGVGLLLSAILALTVAFEVPTGIIADKVSRKYVMLAAICVRALCLATWLLFPGFTGYMLGVVLLALGFAMESGALQAYLYGTLGTDGRQAFGKFWSRVTAMTMLSWSLAYVVATFIGVRYELLIMLSLLSSAVALAICLTLPKDDIAASGTEVKPKVFRVAISHILHTRQLRSLLLTGVLVAGLALSTMYYIGPYYQQSGVETRWVPLLMAVGNVLGAIMFWTLHSWEWFLDRYKLWLAAAVTGLFVWSLAGGVVALCAGFLLMARFLRILQIQFESNIQHLSNDQARATISSVGSFAANLVAASLMVMVGFLAVNEVILAPLQIVLVAGAVAYALLCLVGRRRNRTGAPVAG